MADYYTILTSTGHAKVFAALSGGPALRLARIAVGDGGGPGFYDEYDRDALRQRATLVNQQWIDDLNLVDVDPDNPAWIITEGLIPTAVGGWYIREVGILDDDGDLIAIGVYPETYKPVATAVEADLLIRSIIEVGDADSVELRIDPSQVMATRAWVVDVAIPQALTMIDEKVDEAAAHADRAEQARDIAQFAVGIFPTISNGLSNTQSGQYFWVPTGSEDLLQLYLNDDGSAVPVPGVRITSAAMVERIEAQALADLGIASNPGQVSSAFQYSDPADVRPLISGKFGQILLGHDKDGFLVHQARKLFRYDDTAALFMLVADSGEILTSFDGSGAPEQILPAVTTFHYGDGISTSTFSAFVDRNGVVFLSWDHAGNLEQAGSGGGDPVNWDQLPTNDLTLDPGKPWLNKQSVHVRREYPAHMDLGHRTVFPTMDSVYDHLDALQAEFPDYITTQTIGADDFGNDIRSYTFRPSRYQPSGEHHPVELADFPRIILLTGTHGNEGGPIKSAIHVMDELCRNWKNDQMLEDLRWGCEILYVPVVSPTALNNDSRVNAAGVNINRNYPTGWEQGGSTSPASTNYKGPEPASEGETKTIIQLMQDTDRVTALIDYHSFSGGSGSASIISWLGVRGETPMGVGQALSKDLVAYARRQFPDQIAQDNRQLLRFARSSDGTTARHGQALGIDSYLLEIPRSFRSSGLFNLYLWGFESIKRHLHKIYETEEIRRRLNGINF